MYHHDAPGGRGAHFLVGKIDMYNEHSGRQRCDARPSVILCCMLWKLSSEAGTVVIANAYLSKWENGSEGLGIS